MSAVRRIDHVQVAMPAGGEERARHFYGELLGLEEESKPSTLAASGGCWFKLAGGGLHLGVDADFRPARVAHVALAVADLDALAGALEAAGIACRADDRLPGTRRFYADDPFGNRVEFVEGGP